MRFIVAKSLKQEVVQIQHKITVFEGIGGSGKTTLIKNIYDSLHIRYVHEDNHELPTTVHPDDMERHFVQRALERFKTESVHPDKIVFDRSYLSAMAVMYAKQDGTLTPYLAHLVDFTLQDKTYFIDKLVICCIDPIHAISRRNHRDTALHPIWGNERLMRYANEFFQKKADAFAGETLYVNTTFPFTESEIERLRERLI